MKLFMEKSTRFAKLDTEESRILKEVIEEKFGSVDSFGERTKNYTWDSSKLPTVLGENIRGYLKGDPVYCRVARVIYDLLERDERVAFLQEIVNMRTEYCNDSAIERSRIRLFNTTLLSIKASYGEQVREYIKKQEERYDGEKDNSAKMRLISELEKVAQEVRDGKRNLPLE